MPDYRVYLHDGPDTPPTAETITAHDDGEALVLAEMRLLLTKHYTHAIVSCDGRPVGTLKRDSQPGLEELATLEGATAGRDR
jgi:hypothetical protein